MTLKCEVQRTTGPDSSCRLFFYTRDARYYLPRAILTLSVGFLEQLLMK